MKKIKTPLSKSARKKLKCGQEVLLTGTIYTVRDAAHKKLQNLIKIKKKLPFKLKDNIVYYAGPTPARTNGLFGSCGPTTSSRMDFFAPNLINKGLAGTIGKGRRGREVIRSIKKNKAVYFLAAAGAGAYLAKRIISSKVIAFKNLGPEAIYELQVKNFPLIVGVDTKGKDIYFEK